MARKVHLDTAYIFVPASNRITIDKAIPQEKLLLITNLSTNTVVYNFSDPNLKVNSYLRTRDTQIGVTGTPGTNTVTNLYPAITPVAGQRITGYGIPDNTYISTVTGTTLTLTNSTGSASNLTADPNQFGNFCNVFGTVITLAYNTSSMGASDKLQIFVDEYEETIRPAEVFNDPVSKQRVSTPQALIDTDFELGLQPTKWESLQKLSNRTSFFYNPTTPIPVRDVKPVKNTRSVKIDTTLLGTGTVAATQGSTTLTGTNTVFTSQLSVGMVLFDATNGNLIGAIASVTNDTTATIKTVGSSSTTTGSVAFFYTGSRFTSNGSPGSGIFSPTGTLAASQTAVTTLVGSGTKFLTEVRPGDYIFQANNTAASQYIGQVVAVASDTSLTLSAASSNATSATVANNYFYVSQYAPSVTNTTTGVAYGNPLYLQLTSLTDANGSWLIDGIGTSGTGATATTSLYTAASQVCYSMEAVAPQIAVTGGSASGSVATLTFAAQSTPPFNPGQIIDVANVTPAGYNTPTTFAAGGSVVIACTTTSVTYNTTTLNLGAYSTGGDISFNSIYDNPTTYAYPGSFFYQQQLGGSRLSFTTTNTSASGNIATVSFPAQAQPPFVPGQIIIVSGITATGSYNGTFTVLSCTTSTVSYSSTTASGQQTVAGTITGTQAAFYTDGGNISGFSKITVVFDDPHALMPGAPIFVVGQQTNISGSWYVASVPNANTIVYVVNAAVTSITTQNIGYVYVRPTGNTIHRPTDGGIQISCAINSPNAQLIRQSRRYFRYQSGKGIQYSTGTVFKPSLRVNRLQSDGTSVTVFCKEPHSMYPGCQVTVSGAIATSGSFNGTFTVIADGLTTKTFKYTPSSNAPAAGSATGFPLNVSVSSWSGAQNRLGLFDGTNGMFFKFDGQTLFTVRRNSTELLSGNVQVVTGSALVNGDNETRFSAQLKPGHHIMIRGQIYLVTSIYSDNALTISPEYRGTTITSGNYAKIARIQDYEVPQSQWNIDKCDGNGPSGYVLDLSKIQMYYIDYSWYGAGAIRFGFKDQRGEVIYVNRIAHANNRTEAYLRSGNIAARYETNTFQPNTNLASSLASTVTGGGTIPVVDVSSWPTTGGVIIIPPPTGVANTTATPASGASSISGQSLTITYPSAITAAQAAAIPVGSIASVAGVTPTTLNISGVVTASSTTAITIYANSAPSGTPYTVAGNVYTQPASIEYITYNGKSTSTLPHTLTVSNRAFAGSPSTTGSVTLGSNNITSVTNASTLISTFMHVHASMFPLGTYVVGVSGTTVYTSNPASATNASATLNFTTPGVQGGITFSPTATQPIQAMYFNPMFSPTINHWGSSVIMDGRFDDDKGLIFTAGMKAVSASLTAGVAYPLISIRVGPSVDTGIADILGRKEIINRMQLILNALDVSYSNQMLLDLRLNGQISGGVWQSIGGSSLAQVCYHQTSGTAHSISGGESSYTFLTSATAGVQTYSLDKARDLGNSIMGGGYTNNVKDTYYPDGPDIITLVATPITAGTVLARISWTEAQA
jgi:hypothetical protein